MIALSQKHMLPHIDISSANEPCVTISLLRPDEVTDAVSLLARSMSTNPINTAVFGVPDGAAIRKQQYLFHMALCRSNCEVYLAHYGTSLAGVICYLSSAYCQPGFIQLLKQLPGIAINFRRSFKNFIIWQRYWQRCDYKSKHIHLGPLAVLPQYQGKGVGTLMLNAFCDYMDQRGETAFLETDKYTNVEWYTRFGFQTIHTAKVLDVPNWFMVRVPKPMPAALPKESFAVATVQ